MQEVQMNISRRQMLDSVAGSGGCLEVGAGRNSRVSPNYTMSEHWWGMLIDIPSASAAATA
jgi:hypothetical protein